MKVLIIATELPPFIKTSGLGSHIETIEKYMDNVDISFLIVNDTSTTPQYIKHNNKKMCFVPCPKYIADKDSNVRLKQTDMDIYEDVFKKVLPDIIHAHDWLGVLLGISLKKKFPDIKLIVSWHYCTLHTNRDFKITKEEFDLKLRRIKDPHFNIVLNLEKEVALFADEVIHDSQYMNDLFRKYYDYKKGKVLYYSYHNEFIETIDKLTNKREIRNEYNIPQDDIIIFAIGRDSKQKGWSFIKQVLAKLPDNYKLITAGKGNFFSVKELAKVAYASDIGIALSIFEPFGLSAMDYGLAKLPSVVTDVGGLPETVIENETGFIIPIKPTKENEVDIDIDYVVSKILQLGEDAKLRKQFGEKAHNVLKEKHSSEKFKKNLYDIYEKTLLI